MMRRLLPAALTIAVIFGGCAGSSTTSTGASSVTGRSADANTLNVIAGSELKDLEPYLDQIRKNTGVTLQFAYSGTFAGIDRIEAGEQFDGAWFSQAKYFVMSDGGHHIKAQNKIMLSPVVLGIKESKAKALGWYNNPNVTWRDIAQAAGAGRLNYAMTNPTSSNSGFSATIGVASAIAGTSDALQASQINQRKLGDFFRGEKLTAGSSGWLLDSFVRDQGRLDGVVNYEANLLELNKSGKLREPLTLIYPKEGILTADYPIILLNEAKRPAYDKLVAYLKGAEFQKTVMNDTYRRPVNPDVALSGAFPKNLIVELPFPSSRSTIDAILERYLNQNRIPPHSYFVLDTSGSMEGSRLEGVQHAIDTLAGGDSSITGRFARFENREEITMISFSSKTEPPRHFTMHSAGDGQTLGAVRAYAHGLQADGATAIFSAVESAIKDADASRATDTNHYYSIVLMTDGENNRGDSLEDFKRFYQALPPDGRVRVFPILFGEGSPAELQQLADVTGGRMFDGRKGSLSEIFKEIRGYQ